MREKKHKAAHQSTVSRGSNGSRSSRSSDRARSASGASASASLTSAALEDHYALLYQHFDWHVPPFFNIAQVCSRRWALAADGQQRCAVIEHSSEGSAGARYSYAHLQDRANRLSHWLVAQGLQRQDRVAIVLGQGLDCAAAYMACFQAGLIAMPLSKLFGPEAIEFRMSNSEAKLMLDAQTMARFAAAAAQMPADFPCVKTKADDPALLIYTSGTTGDPKGALIAHRAMIGNLSGFICSQNWFGFDPKDSSKQSQAIFWSPADWAWTGGLMDALLPSLYFGRAIVAYPGRFSAELAFEILQEHQVTHTFLFPTALKAMMKAFPKPRPQFQLQLQGLMSAGEAVGDAVFDYCQSALGVVVNEMFGQTEINYIVGNCAMNGKASSVGWPAKPGSMGRAYPGHRIAVLDEAGKPCPAGIAGDIALHRLDARGLPNPIVFLGYLNNQAASHAKFTTDGWCRTGDMAVMDADGYLWYQGRSDDMFKAAGYRIGPSEVENCLVKHPAVANAAVVPKPDFERGAVVKAYVVLANGYVASQALILALQEHVRGKLAPYEYPKEIEFIDALPMTTTGKVQRRVLRLQEEQRVKALAHDRLNNEGENK